MIPAEIQHKLLFRCVSEKRWRQLPLDKFFAQYEDEVSSLDDLVSEIHAADLPQFGFSVVYALVNGFSLLETGNNWSLFESEEKYREREYHRLWAEFIRGYWSEKVPQKPGLYFVKDRDLGRRSVRELKVVNGRLRDISSKEMIPVGHVSKFAGLWYLPEIPPLKESF